VGIESGRLAKTRKWSGISREKAQKCPPGGQWISVRLEAVSGFVVWVFRVIGLIA
jgi:hypothetical protein